MNKIMTKLYIFIRNSKLKSNIKYPIIWKGDNNHMEENKKYYYISGTMGLTSSGSFSRDSNRWIIFDQNEVNRISTNRPYGATKQGTFILISKFQK